MTSEQLDEGLFSRTSRGPNDPAPVALAGVHPGDVFLFRRSDLLGRAIRVLDGGRFSHAALYTGDGKLAEAIGSGLRSVPVEVSLGAKTGDWIDTYRRKPPHPADEYRSVLAVADKYVGASTEYAYHDVFMCAGLALTRRIPLGRPFKLLVRRVLDEAAGRIFELAKHGRPRPLMCSEFVYMCFLQATGESPGAMRLAVAGFTPAEAGSESLDQPSPVRPGSLLDLARRLPPAPPSVGPAGGPPAPPASTLDESVTESFEDIVRACENEPKLAPPSGSESAPEDALDTQAVDAMRRLAGALRELEGKPAGSQDEGVFNPPGVKELEKWLSHFVSPRDLEDSQTLSEVGRLVLKVGAEGKPADPGPPNPP